VVNRWGFDEVIAHAQLDYRGAPIGWGIVPDQFSLEFAQRALLQREGPLFFDFHMVSSHAPWKDVPQLDAQVREVAAEQRLPQFSGTNAGKALANLERYERTDGRDLWMGALDASLRRGYQATVSYDLRLIARYLAERERDALVIVMGDHQPPVLSRDDQSFDVPVHVLSRSAARLATLRGFTPGLWLEPAAPAALHQADLWPALVDVLTPSRASR
ncbi:MAG TPA: sulfatase-like hydrolase/transferase, partial [Polyangiales bacterium]|nr:sulfatase-like hydrolase/transferase [Polyangiales bacterium]